MKFRTPHSEFEQALISSAAFRVNAYCASPTIATRQALDTALDAIKAHNRSLLRAALRDSSDTEEA